MPDGQVAAAYADIRADSSKLDGDLSKAKALLLQRVRELEGAGKIPLSIDEQFLRAGLDAAAGEARALAAGGIILPIGVELNDALALEEIASLQAQQPIIEAIVEVDEAAAIAAIEQIEALTPTIDAVIAVDPSGLETVEGELAAVTAVAEEAAAAVGSIGANDALTVAALDAQGLTGLYANTKVSVDALTGSIIVAQQANSEYAAGIDSVNAGVNSQFVLEVQAQRALVAKQQATIAAAEGEAELTAATTAGNASLSTSSLGFTRLGGSIALVAGQLLGLPPLLNLTLAVLGRDVVKFATAGLDKLALSVGETKKALAVTNLTSAADTSQADLIALDQAHTDASLALAAAQTQVAEAEAARAVANAALAETSAALFDVDAELLVVEGGVAAEYAVQVAATEALVAAQAQLVVATAAEATAAEAAAGAEVTLAAARAAGTAAAEAETVAAFSSTTILIGLAVVVGAAAIAYKLFADDGSQQRIQEATDRTTASLEKQIEALQKSGGAAVEAGSQFSSASLGYETLANAIAAGVPKDSLDSFNAALVATGKSLSDLPALQAAIFASGKVDLATLFPAEFDKIPEKYRNLASDLIQQERNFQDVKRAFTDSIRTDTDSSISEFSELPAAAQTAIDQVNEIENQLNAINISDAFEKQLNSLAVNGSLAEQALAKQLADGLSKGKIQIQDAIDQLNGLFKSEAFISKSTDIRTGTLIDEAALDPRTLEIYKDVLAGTAVNQKDLNDVTTKFGIDPVDALAAGKKAYDDNTKAIADQEKATVKAAEDKQRREDADAKKAKAKADADAKAAAEVFKKNQEAAQKTADQVAKINKALGTGDDAILGLIGNVGRLNQEDLDNLQKNVENLNSATDNWATSITTKLFPTLDSLFGDKLTKNGKVAFADLTTEIEKNLFTSQTLVNEQSFIDPDRFSNTLKTFGDIVANEGPAAAQKFFEAFAAATPEQRDAFETAAQNAQDAFALDTEKFKAEGKAIGEAIAPEIIKAINAALALADLVDPVTGALQTGIASEGQSPDERGGQSGLTRTQQSQGQITNSLNPQAQQSVAAEKAAQDFVDKVNADLRKHGEAGDIKLHPDVDSEAITRDTQDALDNADDPVDVKLNAAGISTDFRNAAVAGGSDPVAVKAKLDQADLTAQARNALSNITATVQVNFHQGPLRVSYAGGDFAAGERSWVNELGPEGWLPFGASLDKMQVIAGGAPWRDFVAPSAGRVIDHVTTERIIRDTRSAGASGGGGDSAYGNLMTELQQLAKTQREIVEMQRNITEGPPQVHVHTNAQQPHTHGAKVYWAYRSRAKGR